MKTPQVSEELGDLVGRKNARGGDARLVRQPEAGDGFLRLDAAHEEARAACGRKDATRLFEHWHETSMPIWDTDGTELERVQRKAT